MRTSAAYAYCRRLTRKYGPHFSVGFHFLPPVKREAIYAVYAFCRYTDDIVDEIQKQPLDSLLKTWEEELTRCYQQKPRHPITIALADAILRYPIPKEGFLGLIEGCRMDLHYNRYPTFKALLVYCNRVATTIRDLSLPIFGCGSSQGLLHGESLALGLQLTNIVRDVGEDLTRGRIYLPLDEIRESGSCETDLKNRVKNEAFLRLMTFQLTRIREYFNRALPLVQMVDKDSQLAVALMRNVYVALIDRIAAHPFEVLEHPIRLSLFERFKVIRETKISLKKLSP